MNFPDFLGRKKVDKGDEIQILLVKTGLSHSGNKGSLSDYLGHPAQGLSSSAAQDGVGIVQGSHHQGQGRLANLLGAQSALVLSQTLYQEKDLSA